MKKLVTILSLLPATLFAQTFSHSTLTPIPNNQTNLFIPLVVSGLPVTINSTFGVESVCINISHQYMSNLKVRLKSPAGTEILLTDQHGGNGSGYHSTCFREDGSSGSVTSISFPFTGSYIPQNSINTFNTGENPNGTWSLIITDMFDLLDTGYFHSFSITFGVNPPPTSSLLICNTTDASGCLCPDGSPACDLLPDMTASCTNWIVPFNESPGYIFVSNATPNVGWGPLEIHGIDSCFCGVTVVPCSTLTCPGGGPPKQRIEQTVYHKNGSVMTDWRRPAGNMAYHSSHLHLHVDDWIWVDLCRKTGDPNPMNWAKTGLGAKQSYCLINLGDCTSSPGVCRDDSGNTITQADIPNSNLGAVTGCDTAQGIYVGNYDTYGSITVSIPNTACNGDYYIVAVTDPLDVFLEQNDSNNVLVIPATLTQQLGIGSFEPAGFIHTITNTQLDCIANSLTSDSMMWDWGDGTSTTYYGSALSTHVYSSLGTYLVGQHAYNHCGLTYSSDTIHILSININEPAHALASWNVFPNPSKDKINIDYTLTNSSDIKIEIRDAVGRMVNERLTLNQNPGKYRAAFALNTEAIKSGIYFVRISSSDKVANERFVVIK